MNRTFQTVVITGASSGIGADLAREVAPLCQEMVLVARRREQLEAVATELRTSFPVLVHVVVSDLSQANAAVELWNTVIQTVTRPVDLWVNNAGFGLCGSFLETDLKREQEMIALNIDALYVLSKLATQDMATRRRGYLLNVASVAAFQPGPAMAVYFATKAFVLNLTEAIDYELRPMGIRATALCPGSTATEFHQIAHTERVQWMHRLSRSSSRQVARAGLKGLLKGKPVVVPGLLNRWMLFFVRLLPRQVVTQLSARVLKTS